MKRTVLEPDAVVTEVRRIRREIWEEAGQSIAGLLALLDREMPIPRTRPAKRRRSSKRGLRTKRRSGAKTSPNE